MKRNWIALVLALSLVATMTGCGGSSGNGAGTNGSGNSSVSGSAGQNGSGSAGQNGSGSTNGQNGSGSMPSQDIGGGYADGSGSGSMAGDNSGVPGRAGYDRKMGTTQRRTAYDYLHDGRYRADRDGDVDGNMKDGTRDLTQGARDMIRGAGNAIGDAGSAVTGAVGRLGRDLRDMTRSNTDQ